MQKIGVFICWCGSNIAATVDVEKLAALIKAEPGVVYSADYQYMCSENGQQLIKNAIKESLNIDLPECYDKDSFNAKTILLLNHFIDMAVQGYGWVGASA